MALDDPPKIRAALSAEPSAPTSDAAAKEGAPHFMPATFHVEAESVEASLRARSTLVLHRTAIVGEPPTATDPAPLAAYEVAPREGTLDLAAQEHERPRVR